MAGYEPISVLIHDEKGVPAREYPVETLADKPLFGFAGIARPEGFDHLLRDLHCNIVGFAALADHQQYSQEKIVRIVRQAEESGAEACVTTEKDMVKLRGFSWPVPVYVLRMEARLGEDFREFVMSRLSSAA